MYTFDAGNIAGKQRIGAIGMARGDPNGEIGIAQMADNAASRNPVPPNTVTRREDMARWYPAGLS
jgi:hypothetical protein